MKYATNWILTVLIALLISGCASEGQKPFRLSSLAKTDVDMMADANYLAIEKLLRELTVKLYKRNPRELHKGPSGTTIDSRMQQIFGPNKIVRYAELNYQYGTKVIPLAFDENFKGDRVFALMAGMQQMIFASYNYRSSFYINTDIDEQKLYNSARNLEAISWRLNNKRDTNGELYILSNGFSKTGIANFSYARIFGKLIAHQEIMAHIMADQNNRTIKNVVVGFASTALLPI